jgi:hypothetical protein
MPVRWNPFDWFSNDDDDEGEEYDPLKDAEEILEIINDPDFDEWDELGQIPKTNPGRRDPDTGPLQKR